ncbi:hypothetical protein [Nocardia testacea]|uniref:hypothetical protein n=1 Tax=Nocardia testacea TaxID=248551 RepID=UPI0012F6CBE3|nr:hypothetical protein [Nocardia testacea]
MTNSKSFAARWLQLGFRAGVDIWQQFSLVNSCRVDWPALRKMSIQPSRGR